MNRKQQSRTKQIQKKSMKTYIPYITKETDQHDIFIDLLSYGRKSNISKSDIWNYEYV